jgi:hypothetical protein
MTTFDEWIDYNEWDRLDRIAIEALSKINWRLTSKTSLEHISLRSALLVWYQSFLKFLESPARLHRAKQFLIELTVWLKERG